MADEIKRDTVEYRDPTPFDGSKLNSVSDITQAIRHKLYGKDTREAMAQSLEALVQLMQKAGGNQSAEVIAARGNHELLSMREDAQDNAIATVQSTANGKFDTNQAETYLKSITALPETFANLAAIKAKYPSGKNGLMVAADNGHKYIWANSTWTDAGVYQSVGIADGSVTPNKIAPGSSVGLVFAEDDFPNFNLVDNTFELNGSVNVVYQGSIYKKYGGMLPLKLSIGQRGFLCFNPADGTIVYSEWYLDDSLVVIGGRLNGYCFLNGQYTVNGKDPSNPIKNTAPEYNLFAARGGIVWDTDKRLLTCKSTVINIGSYTNEIDGTPVSYSNYSTQYIYFNPQTKAIEMAEPPLNVNGNRLAIGWLSHDRGLIHLNVPSESIKVIPDQPKSEGYLTQMTDVIALGDSITYGLHATDPTTGSWPAIIAANTGVKTYNEGVSSATWQNGGNNDTISFVNRSKTIDWTRANAIVLFGGTNDFAQNLPIGTLDDTGTNTMLGAINNVIKTIYSKNDKANIYLVTPMWRSRINADAVDVETTPNDSGLYLREYVDAIKKAGDKYHLPTLDLYRKFNINNLNEQTWLADGLHPNDAGYQKLAEKIAKFLSNN